ncbi:MULTISPECIES: hypothetical protein [Priestia]|jgi:hypothetical protein|uniref:hypothetical protein n=1 Tax=Priestia TaxID=2800373 RepID=UPI00094DA724|nr:MULTISPECIES: hypothetical protein [Priestia]MBY0091693.1 hypothetical protein [Priestia aryabhattai]MBY0103991.1 hypothetical protein [Priestia aryabhattai]MCM3099783.1 hypothetical protein [Priestia megaterium]MCM3308259.1 hypothetical protein [Priestia megaterium]MED4030325.1 hypothetical protein [Priestia megaterium]
MEELKKENHDAGKLYEKGFKWMRFVSFFMVVNLIFTVALVAVVLVAPQIQETFQWVAFGVYGLTVLYLIFMREVVFRKTYVSLVIWMRTVWNFSFIASAFGAVNMFVGNTHWTLF